MKKYVVFPEGLPLPVVNMTELERERILRRPVVYFDTAREAKAYASRHARENEFGVVVVPDVYPSIDWEYINANPEWWKVGQFVPLYCGSKRTIHSRTRWSFHIQIPHLFLVRGIYDIY